MYFSVTAEPNPRGGTWDTYLLSNFDSQGFKNGKKIGAETWTDLLMTEGMITFINSGEVGVKVGYSTLTRKGCN